MPELVALDLPQGASFAESLVSVWERGDAACVIDQRLAGAARDAQVLALSPTRMLRLEAGGIAESVHRGRGVQDGDALVVCTSGSSAAPKAVVLTHDAVRASATATSARLGVDAASDRWLCCLPCAHIGGLAVVTRALCTGTALEVLDGFDADAVAGAAARGATLVSLVAAALTEVRAPLAFRAILLGGAAPPSALPANVVVTWGMTETGSGVVYDGVPLDGVTVAERDGELFVRAPMLARAYRDDSPLTTRGPDGRDGWLRTRDAGRVHDGRVEVLGRIDDVINTGGEKVWPTEVERVLREHPDVRDVAVWRRPDAKWGQRVVAWVVPVDEPPAIESLRDHVTAQLPSWAAPKELVIVTSLPRGATGKLQRRALEDLAEPA